MNTRPPIPAEIKRAVLVESGHRCAIPTCRQPTIEISHIIPYAEVNIHAPGNLIALCPNCHTRYDSGEIDRKSMLMYKKKLVFISDRYSHYELAVLDYLRTNPRVVVMGPLIVVNLLDNKLIEVERELQTIEFPDKYKAITTMLVRLTVTGRAMIDNWANPNNESLSYG